MRDSPQSLPAGGLPLRCRTGALVLLGILALLAGCARQPMVELLHWEEKCAPGAKGEPSAAVDPAIARPLRDAFLRHPGCRAARSCSADAEVLARVVTRLGSDYVQVLPLADLIATSIQGLGEAPSLELQADPPALLPNALDALFARLDPYSQYWLLDRHGRTLAGGQGPQDPERSRPPSARGNGVKWRVLAPGIGYLAIGHFEADTGERFKQAVRQLKTALNAPLQAAVLDLRGNGGGLLGAGVNVANALLRGGPVVQVEGRSSESRLRFSADPEDLLEDAPLLVLIDGGSASAAEIVAAALQERGRARLLGRPSYGKGSVQTLYLPSCRLAMKLTTARYSTPSGDWIGDQGLSPDLRYPEDCIGADGRVGSLLDCALEHLGEALGD